MGIEGAVLRLTDGAEIAGDDLARVVEGARQFRRSAGRFPNPLSARHSGTGRFGRGV